MMKKDEIKESWNTAQPKNSSMNIDKARLDKFFQEEVMVKVFQMWDPKTKTYVPKEIHEWNEEKREYIAREETREESIRGMIGLLDSLERTRLLSREESGYYSTAPCWKWENQAEIDYIIEKLEAEINIRRY